MRTETIAALGGSHSPGTLLLILGILNLIEGLAAIGDAHFFARNTTYITGSLHT